VVFSRFFIDRPIFATVLSIVITLTGGIAMQSLPLALYPPVSPPNVSVSCNFPGADARTVSESVASPIEEQVNGVENMLYMSSSCTNDGAYSLTITFEHGVDLNLAQIRVQNRVSLATPKLPDVIKQTGVLTRKRAPDILMSIALISPIKQHARATASLRTTNPRFWGNGIDLIEVQAGGEGYQEPPRVEIEPPKLHTGTRAEAIAELRDGAVSAITVTRAGSGYTEVPAVTIAPPNDKPGESTFDQLYLSNYALLHVKEELARVPGVGDISMFGAKDYSMRIWVDPEKLAARNMTANDVIIAIREQNMPVATGQVGQPPMGMGQSLQMTLSTKGRLVDPEEFADIIVKRTPGGRLTRIRDIGRVELGAKNEDQTCQVNHLPASSLGIFQLPEANALETAERVIDKMTEIGKDFPEGVEWQRRYDTTPYIRESIHEVYKTLEVAVILVAIVVLLFLQNWRSAVIPLVAVPVAILGTFGVMAAMGFTLNTLTLFGMVLAIGIVVDDAIVVVEATEHHIEQGMAVRAATVRAMDEVAGPVIAIGLVLSAVFVPCAFITGITGQFFRQFALTIASSTVISTINSLTLSPALAALLLRPRDRQDRDVLPVWGYALLGTWLGYSELAPRLEQAAITRLALDPLPAWWAFVALGAAAGMVAGWLASWPLNWLLGSFFRLFNAGFTRATSWYTRIVGMMLRVSVLVLVAYAGLSFLTYRSFVSTPKGFIPSADMGYLLANVQLPDSASLERTIAAMDHLETMSHDTPGVKHTQAMSGNSLVMNASGSNFASLFIVLDEFSERPVWVSDRIFRLLNLNARQAKVRSWLGWTGKPPDLEERVRKWLHLENYAKGYDVQLASLPGDRSDMPTEGKNLIFVARRDHVLHFRIFDGYGRKVVDTNEKRLAGQARQIQDLRKQLESLWPPRELAQRDKDRVTEAVKSIVGTSFPREPSLYGEDVANELRRAIAEQAPESEVRIFPPAPVRGVGRAGGFNMIIEDRGDLGIRELQRQTDNLVARATKVLLLNDMLVQEPGEKPIQIPKDSIYVPGEVSLYIPGVGYTDVPNVWKKRILDARGSIDSNAVDGLDRDLLRSGARRALVGCFTAFRADVPQFYADVNRTECMAKDVDLQDLFTTLRVYLGSLYVNDLNLFGRTWQVNVQAEARYRSKVDDMKLLKVRSTNGTMVPIAALADLREKPGPLILPRYNMYSDASITGNAAVGISSGQAIDLMSVLASDPRQGLSPTMTHEWTELAFFEKLAGNTAMYIFGFAVVMVFLVLAAQYESWSLPLAVILVVPMCLLSGIAGVIVAKEDINIFTQIGFVVLVGLASKNAILIVEFAKYHRGAGESRRQATLEACRLRLRPIIMTSLAFILGVFPLLLGSGAGAEMRRTLGTTVFSGMLGVTLFGIFLTPVFFFVIDWLSEARVWNAPVFRWINRIVLGTLSLHALRHWLSREQPSRKAAPLDEIVPEFAPEPEGEPEPQVAEPK
jgi:multidrug efflux pump subunit AcrB